MTAPEIVTARHRHVLRLGSDPPAAGIQRSRAREKIDAPHELKRPGDVHFAPQVLAGTADKRGRDLSGTYIRLGLKRTLLRKIATGGLDFAAANSSRRWASTRLGLGIRDVAKRADGAHEDLP